MTVAQIDGAVRSLPTGTVSDQAFSPDGQTLYTSRNGTITAFNVVSGAMSGSWVLGTTLGGIDVSADGKYLVATEQQAGPVTTTGSYTYTTDYYVYRLDLTTGIKTTYTNHAATYDSNFFDAAFLPNGTILLSQNFSGSGFEPLTTLDPVTATFTRGTASYAQDPTLTSSPDKQHVAFLPSNISDAPVYVYTAGSGVTASHSGYTDGVSGYNRGIQAISPAGDLVIQGSGLNVYDGQLHYQRSLTTLYPQFTTSNVAGLAFSPAGDKLYLLDTNAREVFALDTKTWAVLGGYPVGVAIGTPSGLSYGDALTASADGHTLAVLGSVSVQLLDLTKIVNDSGTAGDDVLVGDGAVNYLYGFAGNDSLDGGAGADVMYGGTGDDSYYVDNSGDQVIEYAGQGFDTVYSSVSYSIPANVEKLVLIGSAAISATGGSGADILVGNDAANVLTGGTGDDTLIGNGGNDTLDGGPGNDTMMGGTGDDTYYVDSPADKVIEAAGEGNDLVYASITYVLPDNVERLILTGSDNLSGTGNSLDNRITGNSGDNVLAGLGGNDVIDGGAGFDTAVIASTVAQATIVLNSGGTVTVTSPDGIDTLTSIERIRLNDGAVTTADIATIQEQYQQWGGRAANSAELVYWSAQLDSGSATAATIRAAILADPLGQNHNHAAVTELYVDYGGRAPTTGELQVWDGLIAKGAGFDTVRSALLGDPLGATAGQVVGLYSDYAGRTPGDGEVGFWVGQIKAGTTIGQVRQAILDDSAGKAHTDATVTGLYQTFGGRAPTASELTTWEGLVRGGYTFAQVRTTILDDQLGRTYTGNLVSAGYHAEFGRDATSGDVSTWLGLFKTGVSTDTFLDTLIADRGSDATGTARLAGTAAADTFAVGHGHETVVTGFDAKSDVLKIAYADVGPTPLDPAHARQVFAFDGTPDVLFTLNDGHHVLLPHTNLADLSAANFQTI